MFFGSSQLSTPFTFSFSISILLGPITTPRNPIFLTFYIYFSSLIYKSFSSNLFNISSIILSCPSCSNLITLQVQVNKKNSIEFLLDFLYYLYNYYMVCALFSHTNYMTYHVMVICVSLVIWHFPAFFIYSKSKRKRKRKEI